MQFIITVKLKLNTLDTSPVACNKIDESNLSQNYVLGLDVDVAEFE